MPIDTMIIPLTNTNFSTPDKDWHSRLPTNYYTTRRAIIHESDPEISNYFSASKERDIVTRTENVKT